MPGSADLGMAISTPTARDERAGSNSISSGEIVRSPGASSPVGLAKAVHTGRTSVASAVVRLTIHHSRVTNPPGEAVARSGARL